MATMAVFRLVSCFVAATLATAAGSHRASFQHAAHRSLNVTYPKYRISPLDGSTIALPSQDQLDFQDKEMGILIHFNIATYISIDGCNGVPGLVPNPDIFNPTILNTDQWMDSITASGAKYATLVAKHNCGFTTWPSAIDFETRDNTTSPYNYTVAYSPVNGTDIVKMFSDSAEKYGVGHGFYYSTVVNNFLNVQNSLVNATWSPGEIRITNETYDEIVIGQLTELWTNYGLLTEVSWYNSRDSVSDFTDRISSSGLMEATATVRWKGSRSYSMSTSHRLAFSTPAIRMAPAYPQTPFGGSAPSLDCRTRRYGRLG